MKLILQILHTIIFYFFVATTFIFGTILIIPFALIMKKKHIPFQFAARIWSRVLVFLSGARVTVSGLENIPKTGGLIFAANHQGAADITLLLGFLPRFFRFVIKKELFKIPIFGIYLKLADYISIDRKAAASSLQTLNSTNKVLNNGECILIFPEGTRSKTGELGNFKRGSLIMSFETGTSIIPIGISGSFNMMKKGSFLINLVPISVKIGKPIPFEHYKEKEVSREDFNKEIKILKDTIANLMN